MYLNIVFDILKTILSAGTGIPGSLSNGDLSPFYLLLWNDFYNVFCVCADTLKLNWDIGTSYLFSCDRSMSRTETLQCVFVVQCQCPDTQQGQLGARGKIWVNLKDDFVLFAGLFVLEGSLFHGYGCLNLDQQFGINPAFVIQAGYISK